MKSDKMLPPKMQLRNQLKLNKQQSRTFLFAAFGAFCVVVAYFIVAIDPLSRVAKDQLSIREGSYLFSVFKKPPLDVFVSVYVFNVTNVAEFLSKPGTKLRLEEVGPYVYQEFLDQTNYTYNANGTLTYMPRRRLEFCPERSRNDPKLDIITVANVPLLGASTAAAEMNIFAALALSTLSNSMNAQAMLNMTAFDFLWGYDDPLVKFAANIVPHIITFEKFGILDRMLDEGENEVTIHLPESVERLRAEAQHLNSSDTSKMVNPIRDYSIDTFNGQKGMSYWGYDEVNANSTKNTVCNSLRGAYDGTIFPQNITKNEQFRLYRKSFCRTLPIRYDHSSQVDGVEAYHFELAEDAFDSSHDDPSSSCFCKETKCLKKGLGNITPCYFNIPTAVSYPHFYRSDPTLLAAVDGLSPDAEKHSSEIVLQPKLGVPMRVHSRVQINLLMDGTKFNSQVRPYENLVLPIVWMEIAVERLTPGLIVLLHMLFDVLPYVQAGCVFMLCIFGVSMFTAAALTYFWISTPLQQEKPAMMSSVYGKCELSDECAAQLTDPMKDGRCGLPCKTSSFWFPHITRDRCPEGSSDLMLKHDIV